MLLGHRQQRGLTGCCRQLPEVGAQDGAEVDRRQGTTAEADRLEPQAKPAAAETSQEAVVGQDVQQSMRGGDGDGELPGDLACAPLRPLRAEQREDRAAPFRRWTTTRRVGGLARAGSVMSPPTVASGDDQAMVERIEDAVDLLLARDQRRGDEQRRLLAAGGDQRSGGEGTCGHAAGQRLSLLSMPRLPWRSVELDRPVQAAAVDPPHAGMGDREAPHAFQHEGVEIERPAVDLVALRDREMGTNRRNCDRVAAERRVRLPRPGTHPLDHARGRARSPRPGRRRPPGTSPSSRCRAGTRRAANWNQPPTRPKPVTVSSAIHRAPARARRGGDAVLVVRRCGRCRPGCSRAALRRTGQRPLRRLNPVLSLRRIGLAGDARPGRGRQLVDGREPGRHRAACQPARRGPPCHWGCVVISRARPAPPW